MEENFWKFSSSSSLPKFDTKCKNPACASILRWLMLKVVCTAIDLSRLFVIGNYSLSTTCDYSRVPIFVKLFFVEFPGGIVYGGSVGSLFRFVEHFSFSSISLEAVKIISHFKIIKIITVPRGFDHKSSFNANQSVRSRLREGGLVNWVAEYALWSLLKRR